MIREATGMDIGKKNAVKYTLFSLNHASLSAFMRAGLFSTTSSTFIRCTYIGILISHFPSVSTSRALPTR